VTESQLARYNEWCDTKGLEQAEFVGLEDTNSTVLAVNSDRADYAGTTQTAAIDPMAFDPRPYDYIVQTEQEGAGVDKLTMFLPEGDGVAEPMLAAFEAMFENGEYDRIMTEWGIADVAVDAPVLNPDLG